MGFNDHMPDPEFTEIIAQIVSDDYLQPGTAAYGITQQVLHKGYDSLSRRQRYIYDNQVQSLVTHYSREHPTDFLD